MYKTIASFNRDGGEIYNKINKDNFYLNTKCGWHIQNVGDKAWDKFNELKKQDGTIFKKSPNAFGLYSQYVIDGNDVYRISDHWGYVATCTWTLLNNQIPDWLWKRKPYVLAKANFSEFVKKEEIKNEFAEGGKISDHEETYKKWKSLVNMSKSELDNFYNSEEGKKAGLSSSKANELGIHSGRESARWIMKMKDIPHKNWTPKMCEWAKRQISFISRMSGNKGGLYDDKGNKTRKHTSLLIWGHNPEKYESGGTISQTPAPKEDKVYGSNVNAKGSSKDTESAKEIKFDAKTLLSINEKVREHNKQHPNKKITLASAKAVVRRGMGAYSSTHRPTISGGKPNSRVAWGLTRLNAFMYKIIHGKSKSGKYKQDDDLINELGYSVKSYDDGGTIESVFENEILEISKQTGIKFTKSKNTNSWYGGNGYYDRIRLSDHISKFDEKSKSNNLGSSIDLNLTYYSTDAIIHLLNNTDPFANYKKGDKITHSYSQIGDVIYLSSDYEKGYVEVETKDNRVVKYDMNKFLGKENNFEQGGSLELLAPNGKPSNLTPEQYKLVRTPQFKAFFGDWEKLAYAKINDSGIDEITLENLSKDVSKVVDSNGEPMVVYHGSRYGGINIFDIRQSKRQSSGLKEYGIFFTTNKNVAELYRNSSKYTKEADEQRIKEIAKLEKLQENVKSNREFNEIEKEIDKWYSKVYPVFLNIRKIKQFDAKLGTNKDGYNNLQVDAGYKWANGNDAIEFLRDGKFGVEKVDGIRADNVLELMQKTDDWLDYVGTSFLVFNETPQNIKLADGTNTTFDANNADIRYAKGGMIEVVLNEGNGVVINNLFNQWNSIKNEKDFDMWAENVRETKFGTYGTIGLLELMDRFDFKDSQKVNSIQKNNFIQEIKSALNNYAKGGEVSDWDFEFTGGNNKGQKFSQQQIETIDVYDDNIYSLLFVNGSVFDAKTSETIGLLSITDNVVKLAVILGDNVRSDQKIIRRLQKLAEDSDRVIVENNSQLRSEKRLYPFLLVSKNDATNYTIAEQFQGKLDTPKKALSKKLVQDAIDSGSFLKQIKEGRDVKGVIEIIKSNGLNVPIEILEYDNKEYAKGSLFKPHKTIKQIAKEKNVSLQYANEQLEKGIKIESEHSNSLDVQKTIALQHLDEMIDYYEKLEIMEQPKDIDKYYGSIKRSYSNGAEVDSIYTFPTPTGAYTMLQYVQQVLVRTTEFKKYFGDWELAAKNFLADKRTNFEKHYKNVSKVINLITLEPLVVYHGSSAMKEFFEFDAMAKNQEGRPYAYFADNIQYSQNFVPSISQRLLRGDAKALLYKAFIKINNPFFALGSEFEQIRKNKDGWILTLTKKIYADKEGSVIDEAVFNDYLKATKSQLEKYFEDTFQDRSFLFWNIMAKDYNKTFKTFLIVNGYDGVRYSEEFDPTNYDENNPAQFTKAWTIFDASQVKLADGRNINFDPMNKDIRFEEGGDVKETDIVIDAQNQSRAFSLRNKMGLDTKMDAGGFLLGKKDGKLIAHNDGDLGGIFVGKRHSEGGIDGINKATGERIEVEGEEIQLNSKAVSDSTLKEFNGKKMTNREILSHLNVEGGGKSFKMGGEIEEKLEKGASVKNDGKGNPIEYSGGEVILTRGAVSSDKKYEYNGKMMTTREIASDMNVSNGGVSFASGGNIPQKTHNFVSEKVNDAVDYVNDFINRVYG